jgi:hypothetical protein
MNPARLIRALASLVLLSVWGAVPHLAAQVSPLTPPTAPDGRVPITLVLTGSGAAPTLLRRADNGRRNVIMVDSATVDAQQLSDAVFQLLILEAQDPQGERRANNTAQRLRLDRQHPVYSWAAEALQHLRSAPFRPVAGLRAGSRHRTVQIWVRPLRGRRN